MDDDEGKVEDIIFYNPEEAALPGLTNTSSAELGQTPMVVFRYMREISWDKQ
jgi:hypothetical protein